MMNASTAHGPAETVESPLEAPSAPRTAPGLFTKLSTRLTILTALAGGAAAQPQQTAQAQPTMPAQPGTPHVEKLEVLPRPVPPGTVDEWLAQHPEFAQSEFNRLGDQLADPLFRTREKADELLRGKLKHLQTQANPAPVGIGPYIRKRAEEKNLDPEASARIGRMPTGEYQTTRIPPIRTSGANIVKMLSGSQNQVVLDLTPAGEARLAEALVTVDANANGFWQVLDHVRTTGGLKLRFEGGGRPVLTDKETGAIPTYEFLGQKDTFALLQEGGKHSSRVVVADEPSKGLVVCIEDAKILAGPALPVTVSAAACPPTRLQRYTVSAPPYEKTGSLQNPIQWQSPYSTVEVTVTRGRDMFQGTLKAEVGWSLKAANQNIRVAGIEEHKDGSCTVTLDIGVYEDIPWPPTPFTWDVKTYADGAMTRAGFLSADGKPLGSTRKTLKANMRVMTATYSVSSKPTDISVKGYGSIGSPQSIQFTTGRDRLPKGERPVILEN